MNRNLFSMKCFYAVEKHRKITDYFFLVFTAIVDLLRRHFNISNPGSF